MSYQIKRTYGTHLSSLYLSTDEMSRWDMRLNQLSFQDMDCAYGTLGTGVFR